jgi:DNA-directed RNA polymerase specialized sigma24 family protein
MLTHELSLRNLGYGRINKNQNLNPELQVKLDDYINIVRYQVRRYGRDVSLDDLYELYQEGLLTLCEILSTKKNISSPSEDDDLSVKRNVNTRLKRLRREQWKFSKVSNEFWAQDRCLMTLPNDEEVENELNKTCIQKALARLKPKQSFAISTKFEISGGSTSVSKPKSMKNISKRSIDRHTKDGLEMLLEDPEIRTLRP